MNTTGMAYRKTAVEGASGFGMLIALYDTLAGNLRRAADAERINNIEQRCLEINHALLIVGYLEDWVHKSNGGGLSQELVNLYSSLRRKMIEAQVKRSAEMLEQQATLVLSVREIWQEREMQRSIPAEALRSVQEPGYTGSSSAQQQHRASSWSA